VSTGKSTVVRLHFADYRIGRSVCSHFWYSLLSSPLAVLRATKSSTNLEQLVSAGTHVRP
jgi:hypothetical protein